MEWYQHANDRQTDCFLSRSYAVLNPCFFVPVWFRVWRTTICLAQCRQHRVDTVELWGSDSWRNIYPAAEDIFFYIYLLIFTVFLVAFHDQLAFVVFIPESLYTVPLFPLPIPPTCWFVGKPSFHPSYKEHAEFIVQILNCLQFSSQIRNASLKMEVGFSSACHIHVSFCGLRTGDEFMKCWILWVSLSWRLHDVGIASLPLEFDKAQISWSLGVLIWLMSSVCQPKAG